VPGRSFKPSLMFVSIAGGYLSEEPEVCFTLALLGNIKLGWKDLPRTNSLAYYKHSEITTVKSFILLATGE
jgi:hypothetical protein